jgi:enoyl-CoA hydratase/carnithine racemase
MLMMPSPIDAPAALEMGLADALAEPGTALEVALTDAARLAAGPTQAYGAIKSLLSVATSLSPLEILDREADNQARLFGSDDFAEGVEAFRAKRRPEFGAVRQ